MMACLRSCRRMSQRFFLLSFLSTLVLFLYFITVYFREVVVGGDAKRSIFANGLAGTGSPNIGGLSGWISSLQDDVKYDMQKGQACVHPQLELWHPELKKYFGDVPPLECSPRTDWVYVENGTLRISASAIRNHGKVTCDYTPYVRGNNDFAVLEGESIRDAKDGTPLKEDFFNAKCTSQDGNVYHNIHSGISYKPHVHEREMNIAKNSLGLNILMFGFDSTSRMTWMRNLPKSNDYYVNGLGATILEGYNIVGDGTPQALLPILTGKTEPELPEARRGRFGAASVDGHPWIFKDLKKLGYVTQWGEDGASVGTFTYRMLGFKDQPVDHYMRPFYIQAEKHFGQHKPYCLGSVPRHLNMLNWITELYHMYPNRHKFSFLFHSEFTHGGYSEVRVVDDDLKQFLQYMEGHGFLNNTLLILMADHGARFQAVRQTVQGKFEERMPYFGLRFPPWFHKKHPDVIKNLKINAHRLTTPFDIHETFMDIVNFTGAGQGDVSKRGISLMKEIPAERTCADAAIEAHWCACLNWQPVSTKDSSIQRAARILLKTINSLTNEQRSQCTSLALHNITAAVQHSPNEHLLKFKQSADTDGRLPDLSDDMGINEIFYQVSIITKPGLARYEATLKYIVKHDKFLINEKDISRINKYGSQPHCIMETLPHLRPYCYCHQQLQ